MVLKPVMYLVSVIDAAWNNPWRGFDGWMGSEGRRRGKGEVGSGEWVAERQEIDVWRVGREEAIGTRGPRLENRDRQEEPKMTGTDLSSRPPCSGT